MAVALLILMFIMVPTVDSFICNFPSVICQLQSEVETLKSRVALLEQQVYFTATFNSLSLTVRGGTVVFDKVLMNTGGAYSPSTGVFTAPTKGLYVFLVQSLTNGPSDANWDLYVNGRMVLRGESLTQGHTSNEYVYPVILQPGDKVSVYSRKDSVYNRTPLNIWGTDHSFFGGWLIRAL